MKDLELNALKADLCQARSGGHKHLLVHINDLQSLIMRADALAEVQAMVPFKIGWCDPDDLNKIHDGELYRTGIQRKKGKTHTVQMMAQWVPNRTKKPVDDEAKCLQSAT